MTGEPAHIASKEKIAPELMFLSERALQLSNIDLEVKWPLRFTFSYVQPITLCYSRRSASVINPATTKNTNDSNTPTINY